MRHHTPAQTARYVCADCLLLCHSQVILSAPSDDLRNLWVMALSCAGVTRSFRFWAKKMGHTVKNWRRRFFLVHAGLCYYFENENDAVAKVRHEPRRLHASPRILCIILHVRAAFM